MKLPCINADRDNVMIDLEQIYYIDLFRASKSETKIRFHTADGSYIFRFNGSLAACEDFFSEYGFTSLDAVNVVNINKITHIAKNSYAVYAYFENTNIRTSVSRSGLAKIKHLPQKTIPD